MLTSRGSPTIAPIAALIAAMALTTAPSALSAQYAPPWWFHATPSAGASVTVRPGGNLTLPSAAIQLELSHELPIGFGLAAAWLADTAGEGHGGLIEGLVVYRFPISGGGRILPYAGGVAGVGRYGAVGREHFGGRAGVDMPLGRGRPFLRVEMAYRRLTEGGGTGARDLAMLTLGLRFSTALR